jgi:hypothetical protein
MGKFKRLFDPPIFQGSLREKNYFEGWYLKNVSSDMNSVLSFIPGISLSKISHSFIQVIDGITGWTHYFEFPVEEFKPRFDRFQVDLGRNRFSMDGLKVDLSEDDIVISGELKFTNIHQFPKKFLSPGIMGWYTFVPRMECYHGVVSMDHSLDGRISFKGDDLDLTGGRGYIEKDWGRSFPESWIWVQCNTFDRSDTSFMLSIAKIPWMRKHFIGFLSFLKIGNDVHRFATYTGARVSNMTLDDDGLEISVKDRKHQLHLKAVQKNPGELAAPIMGTMDRRIKESVDSEIEVTLKDRSGNEIFRSTGKRAGLEIMADINELK